MDGIHDMGGMDGFGKVEPEPNEPPFHAAWEGRVLAMTARHELRRRLEHRHVARRAGGTAAAGLSVGILLQALGARHRAQRARARTSRTRTNWHPAMRCARASRSSANCTARRRQRGHGARQVRADAGRAGAICAGRSRAREKYPSADAHAAAALCPRSRRRRRARAGLPCFPGHGGDRRRAKIRNGFTPYASMAENCGARTPIRPSKFPSKRSSPIWSRPDMTIDPIAAGRALHDVASIPRDADGPVFRRAMGGAGLCHGARAARPRRVPLAGMGGDAGRPRSSARRRQAIRIAGDTYYRHWLAALERMVAEKGVTDSATLARYYDRLGPRRRPHAARRADRAAGGRLRHLESHDPLARRVAGEQRQPEHQHQHRRARLDAAQRPARRRLRDARRCARRLPWRRRQALRSRQRSAQCRAP